MNKVYYKGEIERFAYTSNYYHYGYESSEPLSKLDYFVASDFLAVNSRKNYDIGYEIDVKDREILEILEKKYKFKTQYLADIIFEIVYDENNMPYAKEIKTGTIYPIVASDSFDRTYSATYKVKEIKVDDNNQAYACDYSFEAVPSHEPISPNLLSLYCFVVKGSYKYATRMEIEEYEESFYEPNFLGIKMKKKDVFKKYYDLNKNNTYKSNVFYDEKHPEAVPEREHQNEVTILMENIEFLLTQVGRIDLNKKKELENKYNTILDSENNTLTLEPLTIQNLKALEAELEFVIKFQKKNSQDVVGILDKIIAEYNSQDKTPRTIKDIDDFAKIFLKMKDSYSVTVQRNVIEKFACIYIYEIYENKDIIRIEDLENSYYNDILKSIIIYLSSMLDNDIIENNIIINFDNITPSYVLSLIKQIKFKQIKEKHKSMVN